MKKGFTLLELLIVIAILAILATATILVLNPAELLKQARDSQRVTDIANLNSALSLYVTAVSSPYLAFDSGAPTNVTCHNGGGIYTCYSDKKDGALSVTCGGRFNSDAVVTSTSRQIDNSGWLPVDFTAIPSGSPIALEPTDPSNTGSLFYAYACQNDTTYVITAALESEKYLASGGPGQGDGGSSTDVFEVGTTPGLNGVNSGGM